MGDHGQILIHVNRALPHQVTFGQALRAGFCRHGERAELTAVVEDDADLHVVLGPHFAKRHWLGHPAVLLLDRCFWGNERTEVTLGRMTASGGRVFLDNCPGDRPQPTMRDGMPAPARENARGLVVNDFRGDWSELADLACEYAVHVRVRLHPVEAPAKKPLLDDLEWAHIVVGHRTSALVTAILEGRKVVTTDAEHVVCGIDRGAKQWLANLSYTQWNQQEIESGEAWDKLQCLFVNQQIQPSSH